jgi:hypothetical protein
MCQLNTNTVHLSSTTSTKSSAVCASKVYILLAVKANKLCRKKVRYLNYVTASPKCSGLTGRYQVLYKTSWSTIRLEIWSRETQYIHYFNFNIISHLHSVSVNLYEHIIRRWKIKCLCHDVVTRLLIHGVTRHTYTTCTYIHLDVTSRWVFEQPCPLAVTHHGKAILV